MANWLRDIDLKNLMYKAKTQKISYNKFVSGLLSELQQIKLFKRGETRYYASLNDRLHYILDDVRNINDYVDVDVNTVDQILENLYNFGNIKLENNKRPLWINGLY